MTTTTLIIAVVVAALLPLYLYSVAYSISYGAATGRFVALARFAKSHTDAQEDQNG
jgi:hypothetical protein